MNFVKTKKTIYISFFLFIICAVFTACSSFNSEEKAGEIVLTVDQAMVKAAEHSARAADIFEPGTYLEVEIKGGYTASQTIPLVLGRKIIFKGIPVETSVHVEAMLYRNQQDGSKNILYNGTSDSVKISSGENKISLKLKKYVPGGNGGGGNGGNGNTIPPDFVLVEGTTISGQLGDPSGSNLSQVFINNRTVTINDIYVCSHEVTQKEYSKYMMFLGESAPMAGYTSYSGKQPQDQRGKGDNYPAYNVGFWDAIVYCNARSKAEGLQPVYYIQKLDVFDTSITRDEPSTSYPQILETLTDVYDVDVWAEKLAYPFTVSYGNPKTYAVQKYIIKNSDGKYGFTVGDQISEMYSVTYGVKMKSSNNGYRLLTEAEWEYCARGGKTLPHSIYSGTDDLSELSLYAWYGENYSSGTTHVVKTVSPNYLGLYDMSGNVLEWCWDPKATINSDTPSTGPEPTNNSDNISRVTRGGYSWYGDSYCRVFNRGEYSVDMRDECLGFRICRNK